MEYEVFKIEKEDVDAVCKIESELIGETSFEKIVATFDSSTLFYYVLKNGSQVVGFYEVSIVSPEAELFDIAIKKEWQGKGLSKILMEHLFELCKNKNVETIFLEVNSINGKAINLYNKYGFEEYGIRKNYYGENDAILMKYDL